MIEESGSGSRAGSGSGFIPLTNQSGSEWPKTRGSGGSGSITLVKNIKKFNVGSETIWKVKSGYRSKKSFRTHNTAFFSLDTLLRQNWETGQTWKPGGKLGSGRACPAPPPWLRPCPSPCRPPGGPCPPAWQSSAAPRISCPSRCSSPCMPEKV